MYMYVFMYNCKVIQWTANQCASKTLAYILQPDNYSLYEMVCPYEKYSFKNWAIDFLLTENDQIIQDSGILLCHEHLIVHT